MASDCGNFTGEILVDEDGEYIGDFAERRVWIPGEDDENDPHMSVPWGFTHYTGPYFYPYPWGTFIESVAGEPPGPHPQFGVKYPRLIDDFTGPRGLEHLPAIEFMNTGAAGQLWWIGSENMEETGVAPEGDTGWNPAPGSFWTAQFWMRTIADDELEYTYNLSDGNFVKIIRHWDTHSGPIASGREAGMSASVNIYGKFSAAAATLQTSWQFVKQTFKIPTSANPAWAPWFAGFGPQGTGWTFQDQFTYNNGFRTFIRNEYVPNGTLRFKCLHLYPYNATQFSAGVSLDGIKSRPWQEP